MEKWLPTSHKPPDEDHHSHSLAREMFNGLLKAPSRPHTPFSNRIRSVNGGSQSGHPAEAEPQVEEDPQVLKFKSLYDATELRISSLFDKTGELITPNRRNLVESASAPEAPEIVAPATQTSALTSKKRKLDDDYDDYDDDDEDDDGPDTNASPLKNKSAKVQIITDGTLSPVPRPVPSSRPSSDASKGEPVKQKEVVEDARKKLEEAKRREIETVKGMSRTLFFTLESDRDAMLDQQRLDEAERRAEAEAEGHAKGQSAAPQQGSLSNANLGASSLTLKNLIARIDQRRSEVHATESELRALMSEVRKNRSKWASEDKVGQEELYEAAEKVMNELKAQTEHSAPFLQPVKKKDAPDYFQVIKHPMDLGTMTKKLKQLSYKSKQDFVDDLHLIWSNCLKYNSAPDHPMRKHALFMRKDTDKLVPLIPDVVIRDRAEIEAEERRQRIAAGEVDENAEDSDDDDQPIMASRGRKAPAKSSKAPNAARKSVGAESTPNPDTKPSLTSQLNGARADSDIDGGSQGHSTPPPGTLTPIGGERGSILDTASEIPDSEIPAIPVSTTPPEVEDDDDYRLWKQKTKKERAMIATARHKLFRGDKLNSEEEALLRSKSGMRRWQKIQREAAGEMLTSDLEGGKTDTQARGGETLAEGLEPEEESMLPDYYDPLAAIPDLNPRLRWEQDTEGNLIEQGEEFLRLYPQGNFIAPEGKLSKKMADNMQAIQETRKIVSKIGVVKQMQLQTQVYQNQFTKYEPAPFVEADIKDHVMTDAGPLMAPWVTRAALQRCIGELFFHAGFEEFQPSAIESVTDMASDFFQRLCVTLASYLTEEKVSVAETVTNIASQKIDVDMSLQPATTREEAVLHSLHESGLSVNDIDQYAREDFERMGTRLSTMHERMRAHYAELLKPALTDDTAQGQGAFESGEQFVGGDFADDLGEDFFGFKELGLDKEFGLVNLSVPLHLLHNRLSAAARETTTGTTDAEKLFKTPVPFSRVNVENVENEIGLVRDWFRKKLKENGDRPLPEDHELPPKQRKGYGRGKLPASGKIGDGKVGLSIGASPVKKPPAGSKPQNSSASKAGNSSTTNAAGDKKKRQSTSGPSGGLNGDIDMADGDNTITPVSPHMNGIDSSPLKPMQNSASESSKGQSKANASGDKAMPVESQKDQDKEDSHGKDNKDSHDGSGMNGQMVNGVHSSTTPEKEKKKNKDSDGAMMSPESL